MRRQYHPHRTERGVLVWDVHRLVELSRDLPVSEVALGSFPTFDELVSAGEPHTGLIAEADLSYPIILAADGRVMDGRHRICKARMRGDEMIRAVRFFEDPEPDYVDVALEGLPYDEPW